MRYPLLSKVLAEMQDGTGLTATVETVLCHMHAADVQGAEAALQAVVVDGGWPAVQALWCGDAAPSLLLEETLQALYGSTVAEE